MVTISQLSEEEVYMETQTILFDGYSEPDSDSIKVVALQLPVGSKLSATMLTFWLHPFQTHDWSHKTVFLHALFCSY